MKWHTIVVAALALVGAVPAAGYAAPAKDGDVIVAGTCTGRSTAKLKLSAENGRIEVEFEVDQNRNGVRWNVVLRRNAVKVAQVSRVTKAPSGSFEVRRLVANRPGAETIAATATRNGERCTARAVWR